MSPEVPEGYREELHVQDGLVCKSDILLESLTKEILAVIHNGLLEEELCRSQGAVYWPGMFSQIEDMV